MHPSWHTPYVAILLAAVLGVAMVMTQTFEQLTDTFVLAMWPFYALSVGAHLPPAQVAAGPAAPVSRWSAIRWCPAVFIAAAVALVVNAIWTDPLWTSIIFGVVLARPAGVLPGVPCDGRLRLHYESRITSASADATRIPAA